MSGHQDDQANYVHFTDGSVDSHEAALAETLRADPYWDGVLVSHHGEITLGMNDSDWEVALVERGFPRDLVILGAQLLALYTQGANEMISYLQRQDAISRRGLPDLYLGRSSGSREIYEPRTHATVINLELLQSDCAVLMQGTADAERVSGAWLSAGAEGFNHACDLIASWWAHNPGLAPDRTVSQVEYDAQVHETRWLQCAVELDCIKKMPRLHQELTSRLAAAMTYNRDRSR